MSRDPETIQREIEQARQALAQTLDALAERAHPHRLAERGRQLLAEKMRTPQARQAMAVGAAVVALLLVRRVRRRARARRDTP